MISPGFGNVYLTFLGVGLTSGYQNGFNVLCGQAPPTIAGGYATWQTLARPLRRGLSVFQGYDPMQLTCDLLFGVFEGGWQVDDATGQAVEANCRTLGWMAGSRFDEGPSPIVYVTAYTASGGQSTLIPVDVQDVPWNVTSLQWGDAYRNADAYRVYQEAQVTLTQYETYDGSATSVANPNVRGGYFVSRTGRDTALLIAGAPSGRAPQPDFHILARRILAASQNNPCKGTSGRIRLARFGLQQRITHGTPVWVPSHIGA